MYQALYRKWRPKIFDDVVGQTHITRTLKRQVMTGHLSHAYLFTGTRGTGKTTCAKLLARAVNCESPVEGNPCGHCAACVGIEKGSILDVVELDAASNNGVDQVRALRDEAVYSPAAVRRRVYIIDEVHMLSVGAFNALLKILEEPPEHVIFILATTELHKVPATILSRCQRFSFKRIQPIDIQNRLLEIAMAESIDLTEDGAAILARLADGALRDALSLLDQCAVSGGTVNKETVLDALGLAGNTKTAHLMNDIRKGDTAKALTELSELYAAGKDVGSVLGELSGLMRDLLLRKTTNNSGAGLMTGGYDEKTMETLGKNLSAQRLLHMLSVLQDAQAKLKNSTNRRIDAELCLIQLCDRTLDGSVLELSERLSRLESALSSGVLPVPTVTTTPAEDSQRPFAIEPTEAGEDALPPPTQDMLAEEGTPIPQEQTPPMAMDTVDGVPPVEEEIPPPAEEMPQPPPAVAAIPAPIATPTVMVTPQRRTPIGRSKSHRPSHGGGDPRLWQEILPQVLPRMGFVLRAYMSQKLVSGLFDGTVLTLYVPDEGARGWLNQEAHKQPIEQAAAKKLGYPIRVEVALRGGAQEGIPVAQAVTRTPVQSSMPVPSVIVPAVPREGTHSSQPNQAELMQELLSFAQSAGKGIVTIDGQARV